MADNVTLQTSALATVPSGTLIATRSVTYSGDAASQIAPVGIVTFAGSDDAKTATDVSTANPLPALQPDQSAFGTITTQNLNPNSGTATASSTVAFTALNSVATIAIQVTGTYTGALTPQASVDGTNWIALSPTSLVNANTGVFASTIASATVGIWVADVAGFTAFRISAQAAVTGTATVTLRASVVDGIIVGNVTEGTLTGNASVTSATSIFSVDCLGYNAVSVQVTSAGTTCTITYEASNDNATWVAVPMVDLTSSTAATSTTTTVVGMRGYALTARYFRARVSTYTSGTVTAFYVVSAAAFTSAGAAANLGGQTLGAVTTVSTVTNLSQMNGVAITMGAGVSGTGVQRVAIATDGQGQLVDNAAFTDGATRLDVAGYIFDETAGTALTENDVAAARVNANRAQVFVVEDSTTRGQRQSVNTSGGASVTLVPHTAGGLTPSMTISAASTNATSLKASAGQVYSVQVFNTNASPRYFKLYNKASAPTVGTDTPVKVLTIPGNTAAAGFVHSWDLGVAFGTGIAWALTSGVATADTGAVAANEIVVNIDYK